MKSRPSFPSSAPSASLEDTLCNIIDQAQAEDAASPNPHAQKRAADRAREREEALATGAITSYFANSPSSASPVRGRPSERPSSTSSGTDNSPSPSSSRSNSSHKSESKIEYEARRDLRRQHEEIGKIMGLLDLPRSVVSAREVQCLMDRASRRHAEARFRSRSPLSSSSASPSTSSQRRSRSPYRSSSSSRHRSPLQRTRSPSRSSSSRRRSPSPSTSRSTSVKDRLGAKAPLAGGVVATTAGTSSSYSPIYSTNNPPPQSVFRCHDVRLSTGETSGFTDRAGDPVELSETSSRRGESSDRSRKGKGRGKKSGGWKK